MQLNSDDWGAVFAVDVPILELVVRGTIMYLLAIFFLRVTGRRALGELSMLDFIFVLLVAIGAQNAVLGEHASIGSGAVLVVTLVAWNRLLNRMSYTFPVIERLLSPPKMMIIQDGRLLQRNMRRELITREELFRHIREQGLEDVAQVKFAFIEGDGQISVIPFSDDQRQAATTNQPGTH